MAFGGGIVVTRRLAIHADTSPQLRVTRGRASAAGLAVSSEPLGVLHVKFIQSVRAITLNCSSGREEAQRSLIGTQLAADL